MCSPLLRAMGVEVRHGIDDVIEQVDAVMMLRIQRERLAPGNAPSQIEHTVNTGASAPKCSRGSATTHEHGGFAFEQFFVSFFK